MPIMTKQEMFDKAVAGLAAQGFRQAKMDDPENSCAYEVKAKDGSILRCAYSHTMTDDFRKKVLGCGMNGIFADEVIDAFPEEAPKVQVDDSRAEGVFENELQRAHDHAASSSPAGMKNALKDFATQHGLELPEVLKEG